MRGGYGLIGNYAGNLTRTVALLLELDRLQFLICKKGSAWLSQARAVKCLVKSNNERNPSYKLL